MRIKVLPIVFTLAAWFVLSPTAASAQEETQDQNIQAEEQQFEQQIEQQVEQQTGLPAEANVEVQENPQGNLIPTQGEITIAVPNAAPAPVVGGGSTQPLPPTGGFPVSTMLLSATALLLGSGVMAYAVLRRR